MVYTRFRVFVFPRGKPQGVMMLCKKWLCLSVVMLVGALGSCDFAEEEDGDTTTPRACRGSLCLEIYNGYSSTEPCDGAPEEFCNYANVSFTVVDGTSHVIGLESDALEMTINNREVGVEGAQKLTTSNGLLVKLVLDTSYSITEAGAEQVVADAAKGFIEALPDEVLISTSTFASEEEVPVFICADGSQGTGSGQYYGKEGAAASVDLMYDAHDALTSKSQTKLFDAVGRLSRFNVSDPELKLLQAVMVVFTDGADNASSYDYIDDDDDGVVEAAEARAYITELNSKLKVYAVGLGSGVDATALDTLSEGRTYVAQEASELDAVFDAVAGDLSAIYQLRVLVASIEEDAQGMIKLTHDGTELNISFDMEAIEQSSSTGGGDGDDPEGEWEPDCSGGSVEEPPTRAWPPSDASSPAD
jgi:hypothetical protein